MSLLHPPDNSKDSTAVNRSNVTGRFSLLTMNAPFDSTAPTLHSSSAAAENEAAAAEAAAQAAAEANREKALDDTIRADIHDAALRKLDLLRERLVELYDAELDFNVERTRALSETVILLKNESVVLIGDYVSAVNEYVNK